MEVDGQVRWVGAIAFEGTGLPVDESNLTFNDGTGRGDFVLEFDSNGSASSTTIEPPEKMFSASSATLASGGAYLGTDAREYLVEIDTNGTVDTFRWSIDGGANFNDSSIPIPAGLVHTLSAGVTITLMIELLMRLEINGESRPIRTMKLWRCQETELFLNAYNRPSKI